MSSVSSVLPRFGVSGVTFHGSGLPYIGMPLMIACGLPRTPGANTITSYLERRSAVVRDRLRADVVVGNLQAVELQAPPAFALRAQPGVHDGDARGAHRMGLHVGRGGYGVRLARRVRRRPWRDRRRATLRTMNDAAVELVAGGFERLLGSVEGRAGEAVAQGDQRVVGIVIDQEDLARAFHAAGRLHRAVARRSMAASSTFTSVTRDHLHVAEFAEGPAGVVVDALLRIVGGPVLIVEQRIGDAAVGLIHAQNVAAGGERARLGLGLFRGLARAPRSAAASAVSPAPPRPPRPPRAGAFLAGIITVNGRGGA